MYPFPSFWIISSDPKCSDLGYHPPRTFNTSPLKFKRKGSVFQALFFRGELIRSLGRTDCRFLFFSPDAFCFQTVTRQLDREMDEDTGDPIHRLLRT